MHGIKKLCFVFIIISVFLFSAISSFAAGSYDESVTSTASYYVNITRPAENEETTNKYFLILGNTSEDNVTVEIYRYSADDGAYVPFYGTDGSYKCVVGDSGFFSKEVALSKGTNRILIVAKKYGSERVQFSKFSIRLINESLQDIIKNGIDGIGSFFKGLF